MSSLSIAVADLHCGHKVGLTPPAWWSKKDTVGGQIQRETWKHYNKQVKRFHKPKVLMVGGDCIEGKGERSGGTELITSNRDIQCEMAYEALKIWDAEYIAMVAGTPYHVGKLEDWERRIAYDLDAEFKSQMFVQVEDVMFHLRHHLGGSTVPHGRHTAIAREHLWNQIWASEYEEYPEADVILRAHNHYYGGAFGADWLGINLPALTAAATKFGAKQCSGTVHFGVTHFEIKGSKIINWDAHLLKIKHAKPYVMEVPE